MHSKGGLRLEAHVIGAISFFSGTDWAFAGSRDPELLSGKVCALSPRADALLLVGLACLLLILMLGLINADRPYYQSTSMDMNRPMANASQSRAKWTKTNSHFNGPLS